MREKGGFKERYDFSLDSRQLGVVLFAGLVALALMFVLGMSVGRQWEKRSAAKTAAAPAETSSEAEPAQSVVPMAPKVEPPAPAAPKPAAKPAPKEADRDADKKEPEAVKTEELTFPKVLTSEAGKPAPLTAAKKPEPKPAAKKPQKKQTGKYTVQVGAFKDEPSAVRMSGALVKKGYDAFVHETKTSSGGSLFRVQVGRYASRDDASALAKKVEASERIKPYVTVY